MPLVVPAITGIIASMTYCSERDEADACLGPLTWHVSIFGIVLLVICILEPPKCLEHCKTPTMSDARAHLPVSLPAEDLATIHAHAQAIAQITSPDTGEVSNTAASHLQLA